jgi:hypothetical protein
MNSQNYISLLQYQQGVIVRKHFGPTSVNYRGMLFAGAFSVDTYHLLKFTFSIQYVIGYNLLCFTPHSVWFTENH